MEAPAALLQPLLFSATRINAGDYTSQRSIRSAPVSSAGQSFRDGGVCFGAALCGPYAACRNGGLCPAHGARRAGTAQALRPVHRLRADAALWNPVSAPDGDVQQSSSSHHRHRGPGQKGSFALRSGQAHRQPAANQALAPEGLPSSPRTAARCEGGILRVPAAMQTRVGEGLQVSFVLAVPRDGLRSTEWSRCGANYFAGIVRMYCGGTASTSQTPLALSMNLWPARCIEPASISRITGAPRRVPTAVAVATSGDRCT